MGTAFGKGAAPRRKHETGGGRGPSPKLKKGASNVKLSERSKWTLSEQG